MTQLNCKRVYSPIAEEREKYAIFGMESEERLSSPDKTHEVDPPVRTQVENVFDVDAHEMLQLPKEITFIRHAQSLGNLIGKKPLQYAFETKMSGTAWKDGRLSEDGRQLAQSRVLADWHESLVSRILDAQVVLLSPLVRALETCIIVLAAAVRRMRSPCTVLRNMRFKVMADLQEKVMSPSDEPGSGRLDVRNYIHEVLSGEMQHKCRPTVDHVVSQISESYTQEEERTHFWLDSPDDAGKLFAAIRRFRQSLIDMHETKIVIIGHNGWSRWNFAAGLPGPRDETDRLYEHAVFGGRQVYELENLGILTANFADRRFSGVVVFPQETRSPHVKFGLFTSQSEAKAAGLLPNDAVIHSMLVEKKMATFGRKDRWVTFSVGGGKSYLAWGDSMAEPVKYIDLSTNTPSFRYACDAEMKVVHLSHADSEMEAWKWGAYSSGKVKPFYLQPKSLYPEAVDDEWRRLCFLMTVHIKFAHDTEYLTQILEYTMETTLPAIETATEFSHLLSLWDRKCEEKSCMVRPVDDSDLPELRHETGARRIWQDRNVTHYFLTANIP